MGLPATPLRPVPTGREPRLFEKAHHTEPAKIAFYVMDEEGKLQRVTIADLKALLRLA